MYWYFSLILNPQKVYADAISTLAEPPQSGGRFQISKEAYIQTLDVPIPDNLHRIRRECKKVIYTNIPELWSVENDKIKLAKDIQTFVELFNSINTRVNNELLRGGPIMGQYFLNKFILTEKFYKGPFELSILPDTFKKWLL